MWVWLMAGGWGYLSYVEPRHEVHWDGEEHRGALLSPNEVEGLQVAQLQCRW